MPSISDSINEVKAGLSRHAAPDHDAILAHMDEEIDRHNEAMEDLRASMRRSKRRDGDEDGHKRSADKSGDDARRRRHDSEERTADSDNATPLRFRFKTGVEDPSKKRKRSSHVYSQRHHHRSKRRHREYPMRSPDEAHPFPREQSRSPELQDPFARKNNRNTSDAFRESLFDALADDEGAEYWSNVYGQPIHRFPRPSTAGPRGELEEMNDEQYAAYVKTKMWEKKHPEIMLEREKAKRKAEEEAARKTREKKKFMRDRERKKRRRDRQDSDEYSSSDGNQGNWRKEPADPVDWDDSRPRRSARDNEKWEKAWQAYLSAWEVLKTRSAATAKSKDLTLPWPVLSNRPVNKANIEAFLSHAPLSDQLPQLTMLKAERVRWHPDKIQHRFSESVDADTLKMVTSVFQVVDGLVELERRKA